MNSFIVHIERTKFRIEPVIKESDQALGQFKIYEDNNVFTLNEGNIDDIPAGHLMGVLTVNDLQNPKDFDFDGSGKISGDRLMEITQIIIEHFKMKR